jgi:hypothetical protein
MSRSSEGGAAEFGAESLGPEEHARCMREEYEFEIKAARRLLDEGKGHNRKEVAEAFVRRGIRFMKGPFRVSNFSHDEQERLPTNDELADCAKRIGADTW